VLVHQITGRGWLLLEGEIDFERAPQFADALTEALSTMDGTLRIDVGGVSFLDSWGIALLAGAWREANQRGAAVVLHGASESVRRLLEICAMAPLFEWEA
jgi:anti-anti-sigma factor